MGSVGSKVLREIYSRSSPTNLELKWVADSKSLFKKSEGGKIGRSDLSWILRSKEKKESEAEKKSPKGLEVTNFRGLDEELTLLNDELGRNEENWVVINSTYMKESDSFKVASLLIEKVRALITADKTAWAKREYCEKLFLKATERKTLLDLNCTVGVWNDQMDYVPLFLSKLGKREGLITKRDNSSLNLFFAEIDDGLSSKEALAKVTEGGFLEPGATDLRPEVRDQVIKLEILANICGALTSFSIDTPEERLRNLSTELEQRADPSELAAWHLSGLKKGSYPALVSKLDVRGSIEAEIELLELPRGDVLARSFRGKNVVSTRLAESRSEFVHAGYGGAPRTAKKLIHGAERASKLVRKVEKIKTDDFIPIPVLAGMKVGDAEAMKKSVAIFSKVFPKAKLLQ